MNKDLVFHPKHYNKEGRRECWDEMMEIFGPEAVMIFDILSAYKYHYRAGLKDGNPTEQDLEKIKNYMSHADKMRGILPNTIEHTCDTADKCYWTMLHDILDKRDKEEIV